MNMITKDRVDDFLGFVHSSAPFASCGGEIYEVNAEDDRGIVMRRFSCGEYEDLIIEREWIYAGGLREEGEWMGFVIKQRVDCFGAVELDSRSVRRIQFLTPQNADSSEPMSITSLEDLTDEHYLAPVWCPKLWPDKQPA